MRRVHRSAMIFGAAGLVLAGLGGIAAAQSNDPKPTPKSWNYEIKDGKRVPKGNRVATAEGGWREEIRQGNCVTIKEKSSQGEYKETRRCD